MSAFWLMGNEPTKERLMTDADTPHVPDLWWSKKMGVLRRSPSGRMYSTDDGHTLIALPADAVKLGDVSDLDRLRRDLTATLGLLETERETLEAAENELADLRQHARNVAAQRDAELAAHKRVAAELDALRADIRAVLDTKQPYIGWHREQVLARLDREPGREEPGRCDALAPESDLLRNVRQCQLISGHRQAHSWHGDDGEFSQWSVKRPGHLTHGPVVEHQPDTEIARADAWARECEDLEAAAAEAAETAAVEGGEPEPSAYDMDPDIDDAEDDR